MQEKKPAVVNIKDVPAVIVEGGERARRLITQKKCGAPLQLSACFMDPGEGHVWHIHEFDEVCYLVRGKGTYSYDIGGKREDVKLNEGDAFFIPKGLKTQFINMGTEPLMLVCGIYPPIE